MRYLRLLGLFFKNSLLVELEYRTNFLTNVALSFLWLATRLFSVLAFYQHTDTLGGWRMDEALIVLGLFNFFSGLMDAILYPNVQRIVEHIQQGTMDFILLKPVNSQFLASLRHYAIWGATDMLSGMVLIGYALRRLGVVPAPGALLSALLLLAAGIVIVYSVWMLLITTAFWFVRVENITELFQAFFTTGRFPVTAFDWWLRIILTFVIPIAFLTTFPASALLGTLSLPTLAGAVVLAAALLCASMAFWNFAVRFYASASS